MGSVSATMDLSEWDAALKRLSGPLVESLARRMCIAGGRVLRDEAKLRVPHWEGEYNPLSRGSQSQGTLRDSIFVAFNENLSGRTQFTYSVSWNHREQFWGRFVEFGYYRRWKIYQAKNGLWYTAHTKDGAKIPVEKATPVPARPFLATAYDSHLQQARDAMIARGKEQLPILLAGA